MNKESKAPVFDRGAEEAAAIAKFSLGRGNTDMAAFHYAAAASLLEDAANKARKSQDRNLYIFLAASHYYYGGHYQNALKLAQ